VWAKPPWTSAADHESSDPLIFPSGPSRSLARSALGLGIVPIPTLPSGDPDSLLLAPSELRRLERESRRPLSSGEDIGQYRVRGPIGYGGQGWVYLASDRNLDNDPVAVKGLRMNVGLDSGPGATPPGQLDIAAERRALIEVKHPDIVDIRNFVQRPDTDTGRIDDFIVLEFIDGESLAQKMTDRGRALPVAEAIAYILAVLPALAYLHDDKKMVYGDLTPANIMHTGDRTKLVDLGGVRQINTWVTHRTPPSNRGTWTTPGFTAPEVIHGATPSTASDIYTVGRTLAVLAVPSILRTHPTCLPRPGEEPIFGKYESFYRLLVRATATDPRHRFTSVAELAEQLSGVLYEVVALDRDGISADVRPSALFTGEFGMAITDPHVPLDPVEATLALPRPCLQDSDPAAGFLGSLTVSEPVEVLAALQSAPPSPEVTLRQVLAHIGRRDLPAANFTLAHLDGHDWRYRWYRGLLELASEHPREAGRFFTTIQEALPGEAAPKLALAVCAESSGECELARHYYQTVWRTGHAFVGAAFGVARTYINEPSGNAEQAVEVLESVPDTLHHHLAARVEALRLRMSMNGLDEGGLRAAASHLKALRLGDEEKLRLRIVLWKAALAWLDSGGSPQNVAPLLDRELTRDSMGRALEHEYLACRRHAPTRRARVALVGQAHAARPWTRW
jgi:serine/threonine-protein kinase PknG